MLFTSSRGNISFLICVAIAFLETGCTEDESSNRILKVAVAEDLVTVSAELIGVYASNYQLDSVEMELGDDNQVLDSFLRGETNLAICRSEAIGEGERKMQTFDLCTSALVFIDVDADSSNQVFGFMCTPEFSDNIFQSIYKRVATTFTECEKDIHAVDLAGLDQYNSEARILAVKTDTFPVYPSQSSIADSTYPLRHKVYLLFAEGFSDTEKSFASYALSERGQRIILKEGLLPADIPEREIKLLE